MNSVSFIARDPNQRILSLLPEFLITRNVKDFGALLIELIPRKDPAARTARMRTKSNEFFIQLLYKLELDTEEV